MSPSSTLTPSPSPPIQPILLTPELLEHILLALLPSDLLANTRQSVAALKTLLLSQRVCKAFQQCIQTSPAAQRALYFRPWKVNSSSASSLSGVRGDADGSTPVGRRFADENVLVLGNRGGGLRPGFMCTQQYSGKVVLHVFRLPRGGVEASWRRMRVFGSERGVGEVRALGRDGKRFEGWGWKKGEDGGVRFGDVVEFLDDVRSGMEKGVLNANEMDVMLYR